MNKIIVANWKMNPATNKEAQTLFSLIKKNTSEIKDKKIIICPPFPFLSLYEKSKKLLLGAQNVSSQEKGSYTGDVSPSMLSSLGVSYVIVGHGEVRAKGEDDSLINKKIKNLLKNKLIPILCVGEKSRDEEGDYLSFLENQIRGSLVGLTKAQAEKIILAYEPLWAIGKEAEREANKEEFVEVKIFIKKILADLFGQEISSSIPVLYGGSVNQNNAKYYAVEGEADGLLIGRDSLDPEKFKNIINSLDK